MRNISIQHVSLKREAVAMNKRGAKKPGLSPGTCMIG